MYNKIHMAPIMGHTDSIYRNLYSHSFNSLFGAVSPFINRFRIPGEKKFNENYKNDLESGLYTVPQILTADSEFLISMANKYKALGYDEVNLNLACPSPVMTKKGMGAALLDRPAKISKLLEEYYKKDPLPFSVKCRTGMESSSGFAEVLNVLNSFPVKTVTLHGRTAEQQYGGDIDFDSMEKALSIFGGKFIYSGDINSLEDAADLKNRYVELENLMLGRGLLKRPQLSEEIAENRLIETDKDKILKFHDRLMAEYSRILSGEKHLLVRVKSIWAYLSFSLDLDQRKFLKKINKCGTIKKYSSIIDELR